MQFIILRKTYASYGACLALSELGTRLARRFGEEAFGLKSVEVIVWFETTEPTKPGLEQLRTQFRRQLPLEPTASFEKKRQRLRLAYESKVPLVLVGDRHELPPRSLGTSFDEMVNVFDSMRLKLAGKPGIDYPGFVSFVRAVKHDVCSLDESEEGTKSQNGAAASWRQRFGVDWNAYHDQARALLDDPFYWDPSNDESPHAANAGAILLADFQRWRSRHPTDPPWDFLVRRYRQNGILGRFNEFRATKPIQYEPRDGLIASMHDQDVIALAFALLKVDGACDPKVGQIALEALARRRDSDIAVKLGWKPTDQKTIFATLKLEADLRKCLA
ncbi:hypothetical protein [Taklimakanibacter deserti]|uniref:hypothetical protein n=1 Tax=Taklimakanibacter deserti TaxID=2267839 RepID=UPI000E65A57B